jgi:hypothetical protein
MPPATTPMGAPALFSQKGTNTSCYNAKALGCFTEELESPSSGQHNATTQFASQQHNATATSSVSWYPQFILQNNQDAA